MSDGLSVEERFMHERRHPIVAWASRPSIPAERLRRSARAGRPSHVRGMTLIAVVTMAMVVGCGPKTKPGPDKRPVTSQPTTQPSAAAPAEPMALEDAIKLIDARSNWTDFPPIDVPRHPAEKYLRDWVIVIDPGHGGEDGGDSTTQPAGYK